MKVLVEESIQQVLRLRREQLRLTQAEVGEKLGLSAMGLSYLERGSRNLKVELLELWAEELGLEVEIRLKETGK